MLVNMKSIDKMVNDEKTKQIQGFKIVDGVTILYRLTSIDD